MKSGQKQSNTNNKKSRGRAEPEQKSLRHKELCSEGGTGRGSQQLQLQKTAKAERFVGGRKGGGASGQMVFISALLALAFEMSENSATKRRCRNYPAMVGTHGGHILLAVTVTVGPVVAYYVVAKPFNMGSISARHQKLRVCVRVCDHNCSACRQQQQH